MLDLLVEGKTNAEIAVRLGITPDGAKWHISELLSETGTPDRQKLADWWRQRRSSRGQWLLLPLPARRMLKFGLVTLAAAAFVIALAAVALHETAGSLRSTGDACEAPPQSIVEIRVPDTAPDWSTAHLACRDGEQLELRLDATGELVRVDLPSVGVFDCRVDCYYSDSTLRPIDATDDLCIGWLGIRDGQQDGMLWVDRYSCQAGGRVIPP